MNIKTLLLSSAATFVVLGGAQAADLSIAEPIDSVRVCDAFGAGYWYIPGTETCLKIGGSVEFDVNIHTVSNVMQTTGAYLHSFAVVTAIHTYTNNGHTITNVVGYTTSLTTTGYYTDTHASNYDFATTAKLNITAKSVTDYGDLVGYVAFRGDYNNAPGSKVYNNNNSAWYLDTAYLSLGPLLAGYTDSTFAPAGTGGYTGSFKIWTDSAQVDQLRLTFAMSGFGVMLGIEDPRDRWGTLLSCTYNMPDLVAAVTANESAWSGKLSVGFNQLSSGSAYGIAGSATINLGSGGDLLKLGAAYGNGSYTGIKATPGGYNNTWTAFAAFKHVWSPTLSSGLDIGYASDPGAAALGATSGWKASANLVWAPVSGFSTSLGGYYTQLKGKTGTWTAQVALKRSW